MGSVVTYWSGSSKEPTGQAELFAFVAKLAALSDARLRRSEVPRAANPESTSAPRESPVDATHRNVVQFDHEVTGRVFIGNSMLLLDQLDESIRHSARLIDSPGAWQSETSMASLAVFARADERRYAVEIPAFLLRGIAFRLYDPRRLYPGEDWMSFAFVQSPDFPELDGQIVHAFSHQGCAALDGEWFQRADWVIDTPSIHLRYYLEEWFDLLMVWVKVFFMPELEYWRNEVLNRIDEIKPSIDRLITSDGREIAKQAVFEYILEGFENEANQWEMEMARIADDDT